MDNNYRTLRAETRRATLPAIPHLGTEGRKGKKGRREKKENGREAKGWKEGKGRRGRERKESKWKEREGEEGKGRQGKGRQGKGKEAKGEGKKGKEEEEEEDYFCLTSLLGLYSKTLATLEESSPTRLDPNSLINIEKLRAMYRVAEEVKKYQTTPYKILVHHHIRAGLKSLHMLSDDQLNSASQSITPREPK